MWWAQGDVFGHGDRWDDGKGSEEDMRWVERYWTKVHWKTRRAAEEKGEGDELEEGEINEDEIEEEEQVQGARKKRRV